MEILEERNDVQSASAMSRLGSRLVPEDLEIRREELRRPSDVRLKNEGNRFESGLARGEIQRRDMNIREIEWKIRHDVQLASGTESRLKSGLVRLEKEVKRDNVQIESKDSRLEIGHVRKAEKFDIVNERTAMS